MAESRLSYVHGASATPLVGETIGRFLEQAATRWAYRDALVSLRQDIRWSYRELLERLTETDRTGDSAERDVLNVRR